MVFMLPLRSQHAHELTRQVIFPDIPGFMTISSDLHMHSVFSDGSVWPDIRVQEAIKDSIDIIAVTEHLEYTPHIDDIPIPDRNRSYELYSKHAKGSRITVINGSEITRSMPPGHSNAIFVEDANALLVEDSVEVFREAGKQGAFVFWNHPNWLGQVDDGIARLHPVHDYLINEGLLHGIEVVNEGTYSEEALQIALERGLTILGTSDIHGLVDWQFGIPDGGHRPITLVFARDKSMAALKEALFDGRTVVYFNHRLIGKEEWLVPLIEECLVIESAAYIQGKSVAEVWIRNRSNSDFILANQGVYSLHEHTDIVHIKPMESAKLQVKVLEEKPQFELTFQVMNATQAPRTHPVISWDVNVQMKE
jgi:hypothetical protein